MDVEIADFSSVYRKHDKPLPPGDYSLGRSRRVMTHSLPTGQLQQILALNNIPSIAVSAALVSEAKTALQERQPDQSIKTSGLLDIKASVNA